MHALDPVEKMVGLARRHAAAVGVAELLAVEVGDVNALAFEDDSFDLVVALGVTSWLAWPESAIGEMARVTAPGGYLLLTDGNRLALRLLLDPWKNLALAPLRRCIKGTLERVGILQHSPKPVHWRAPVFLRQEVGRSASVPSRSCAAESSQNASVSHCTTDYNGSPIETRHSCAPPACPTSC